MSTTSFDAAAAVCRTLEAAFNQGDFAALDAGLCPDALFHDPGRDFRGPAELRHGLEGFRNAFPDFRFSVLDQLACGDRVVIRYRGQGTQRGAFLGVPASGRRIDYSGLLLVRLGAEAEAERIAEVWAYPDQLGVLTQLGARLVLAPGDA